MTDPITESMMRGAAGAGGATYINDIFNIDVYKGKQNVGVAITNGMDYTEDSMVIIKNREEGSKSWWVFDNKTGIRPNGGNGNLFINHTLGANLGYGADNNITRNATGFVTPTTNDNELGEDGDYYVSYSLKKTENFFDIVNYTGTGSVQHVPHNLGAQPGMMWVKEYGANGQSWFIYHKNATAQRYLKFDNGGWVLGGGPAWNGQAPSATHFTVNTDNATNGSGKTYVAYLFADHSNNSGTFGEEGDQNIIACGQYYGNANSTGPTIDLGWEPEWVVIKRKQYNEDWFTADQMQQMPGTWDKPTNWMKLNTTDTNQVNDRKVFITPTGFKISSSDAMINQSGEYYIYFAIRRPELSVSRPIESPTEVFDMDNTADLTGQTPCFPVRGVRKTDFATARGYAGNEDWYASDRKMGRRRYFLNTSGTPAASSYRFDFLHAWNSGWSTSGYQTWAWARNPGSFDVQGHLGTGGNASHGHRLGVVPEMMWVKRTNGVRDWSVYHFGMNNANNPQGHYMQLNEQQWAASSTTYWNSTVPTATHYSVGSSNQTNGGNDDYHTYLFASKAGVSKCGWYTGTGAAQTLTFGFQPRFVLIKCSNANNTKWAMWDSLRGWDKCIDLSQSSAQTNFQAFTVTSTGITLMVGNGHTNDSGRYYIYYAHA